MYIIVTRRKHLKEAKIICKSVPTVKATKKGKKIIITGEAKEIMAMGYRFKWCGLNFAWRVPIEKTSPK